MILSISTSMVGLAMPARLYDPLVAAACDEKYGRMLSPGVADMLMRSIVMSKSNASTRARYCTASISRMLASIPSVPRFLM